jgi:hypothetical protein
MQPSAESSPSTVSFASLIAALAAPARKPDPPAWEDVGLDEDVTTLSYESALRTHARYRPTPDPVAMPPIPRTAPQSIAPAPQPAAPVAVASAAPVKASVMATENKLKCSSITIRMSAAECAQLRSRAAEAGMTISAYLRSCTLEAETLRAQVKEVMAELRAAATQVEQNAPAPAPAATGRNWRAWLGWWLPRAQPIQHAVRAY